MLSNLDGYGKQLYEQFFAAPVYAGEVINFDYDGDRLIRWLLKLSYNSARAQNADTRVLREYRKMMTGEAPLNGRIRCWLNLVTATCFDSTVNVARPARRDEEGNPNIEEPLWFRICQFRLPTYPALALVQRIVLLNSFAFNSLIAPVDAEWPCEEFDKWGDAFTSVYPEAQTVLPGTGRVTVAAGGDHAAESIYPLMYHYSSRFVEEQPYISRALKGEMGGVMLHVPRELIEKGDIESIATALRGMVSTRERATAFRQRVVVMVSGFDGDPRAIWQFPKARQFFRRLFTECPFVMLLSHAEGGLLKLIANCWTYEDGLTEEVQRQRMHEFLILAFHGLNDVIHKLAFSEGLSREISDSAASVLFGE